MKFFVRFALLVGALALPIWSHAQISNDSAEQLMRKSGLWKQLEDMPREIRMGMMQVPGFTEASPEDVSRIGNVIDEVYAPEKLQLAMKLRVAERMKAQDYEKSMRWHVKGIGKKLMDLEDASMATMTEPAVTLERGNQLLNAASQTRRASLQRLVRSSKTSEFSVSSNIESAVGAYQGVMSVAPPFKNAPSVEDFRAAMEKQRAQMIAASAGTFTSVFAVIYEKASDSDLRYYIEYFESSFGAAATQVLMEAMQFSLVQAAQDFGKKVVKPKTLNSL